MIMSDAESSRGGETIRNPRREPQLDGASANRHAFDDAPLDDPLSQPTAQPKARPDGFRIGRLTRGERDVATWAGLGGGIALLVGAMLLGGALPAYADLPAFLMVIGGTAAVTLVSFSLGDTMALPGILTGALFHAVPKSRDVAQRLIALAEHARRFGVFSLEQVLPQLRDDPFLIKALALAIDHVPSDALEQELKLELQAMLARHSRAGAMLRRGGEVAPAMGLIGTLVGLVQMLSHLNNPASLGPAMAVAILATLYGAVLANMVLVPLGHKLDRNSQSEALTHHLTILAAASIAREESPLRTEVLLNSILPPAERIACFD